MDGLLIDTVPIYAQAMIRAACDLGHDFSRPYVLSLVGLLGEELKARLAADRGSSFPVADFLQTMSLHLAAALRGRVPLKPGAAELVASLAARGTPLAVATSLKHAEAEHHLSSTGLLTFFRCIVARDDVARGKPHPDVYLKAANDLGYGPSSCVALEDSFNGVRAAHAAGAMTIMVPDVLQPTPEIERLCVCIASHLDDVGVMLREGTGSRPFTSDRPG